MLDENCYNIEWGMLGEGRRTWYILSKIAIGDPCLFFYYLKKVIIFLTLWSASGFLTHGSFAYFMILMTILYNLKVQGHGVWMPLLKSHLYYLQIFDLTNDT
jgi:hypothetical protein